jgi:hypothetical protein
MSSKLCNIINRLPAHAEKSQMLNQHGAVLVKNGIPLVYSYNKIIGGNTMHAECDVIRRYLLSQGIRCREKEQRLLRGCKQ